MRRANSLLAIAALAGMQILAGLHSSAKDLDDLPVGINGHALLRALEGGDSPEQRTRQLMAMNYVSGFVNGFHIGAATEEDSPHVNGLICIDGSVTTGGIADAVRSLLSDSVAIGSSELLDGPSSDPIIVALLLNFPCND